MEKIKIEDLSLWECFYWVARKRSFSAAALQLRSGVPAVSKKIGKLESLLDTRLFSRTTRQLSVTQAGAELLPQIEALLGEISAVESRLDEKEAVAGLIRVACLPSMVRHAVAPALARYQEEHPAVRFFVHLSDHIIDLIEAQIDVAIRVQRPTGADFVFRKLIPNNLVLVASKDYLRKHGEPKRVEDLVKHRLLMLKAYEGLAFANGGKLGDFRDSVAITGESGALLTDLALNGAGIAARSWWDVKPLVEQGLLTVVLKRVSLEALGDVYAVTPHRTYLPQRVRHFLEFLQKESKSWV